jgi:uncharacterized protein YfiM (DUF2279 family)
MKLGTREAYQRRWSDERSGRGGFSFRRSLGDELGHVYRGEDIVAGRDIPVSRSAGSSLPLSRHGNSNSGEQAGG